MLPSKSLILEKLVDLANKKRSVYDHATSSHGGSLTTQAKALGVVHVGWGRYAKKGSHEVSYIAKDGRLVKVSGYSKQKDKDNIPYHEAEAHEDKLEKSFDKISKDTDHEKIAISHAKELLKNVDPKIIINGNNILTDYTADGYKPINDTLRGTRGKRDDEKKVMQKIKALDGLFKNTPGLPEDCILYFGLDAKVPIKNGVWVDKGYRSTSTDLAIAKDFASHNDEGHIIELHAPKGTRAIHVQGVQKAAKKVQKSNSYVDPDTDHSHEYEVLLDRGTKIKIHPNPVKVRGITVWKAEVVKNGNS